MEVKNYKKIGVIIFVATAVASLVTLSKMSAEEPIQANANEAAVNEAKSIYTEEYQDGEIG